MSQSPSRFDVWSVNVKIYYIVYSLKMTNAQLVATSVTVNNNDSTIQDYVHPDNQRTQPTFEMTPGFKPFTV